LLCRTYDGYKTRRTAHHKCSCNNPNSKNYDCKKCRTIRDDGGWDNWQVVMIEEYKCNNKLEATKRERECYEELKAKMNTYRPYTTQQEYIEHIKVKKKEYYENKIKKITQYNKDYYVNHKEKIKERIQEYNKTYRENNTEKLKDKGIKYYEANKETRK
jgi:hypothetical protein